MTPLIPAPFALICLNCFNGGSGDGGETEAETCEMIESPPKDNWTQVMYHCHTCGARYEVPDSRVRDIEEEDPCR